MKHPLTQQREKLGMSARDFAAEVGVSFRTVYRIESGESLSMATMRKVIEVISAHGGKITADDFLTNGSKQPAE